MSGNGIKVSIASDGWSKTKIIRASVNGLNRGNIQVESREEIEGLAAALQAWLDAHPEEVKP